MKKIRFNLKFFKGDGNFDSVRSLAELQDKFNLDDLYEYFVSGQLVLWLQCHGEDAVAEKVSAVAGEKNVHNQIAKLFDALGFDFDSNEKESAIASYLFPLEFLKRRAKLGESIKKVDEVVRKDVEEYAELLKFLIYNREDFAAVKAGVKDILRYHAEQFKMDYMRFYEIMVRQCPLAIFAVLMDKDYRDYFLASSESSKDRYLARLSDVCETVDVSNPLQHFKTRLGRFLAVSGTTSSVKVLIDGDQVDGEAYLLKDRDVIKQISDYEKGRNAWQDEVDGSKKVMVLWNDGVEARPYHDNTNQYKPGELNGKFEIMNGLEYRVTGYNTGCLLYMEV
jgi:hypothetical protein